MKRLLSTIAIAFVLQVITGCTDAARDGERPIAATAPLGSAPAVAVGESVQAVIADAAGEVREAVEDPVADAQRSMAATVTPAVLDVVQVVQEALPTPPPPPPPGISEAGAARIAKHEILSPSYYARNLQGFACPGETSGPTCGIGCDLGMHTRATIAQWWHDHPQVSALQDGSGVRGFAGCRSYRSRNADVRTPYALALQVYRERMLPVYWDQAARAYRKGWDTLPQEARDGLTDVTYVRGGSMAPVIRRGQNTRRELIHIAEVCVPSGDVPCIATQLRKSCWVWEGRKDGAGLCRRMREAADYIEGKA